MGYLLVSALFYQYNSHFEINIHTFCSEIARTLPSLEALQKVLDQPLSPGSARLRNQVSLNDRLKNMRRNVSCFKES